MEGNISHISTVGDTSVLWRDSFSTVGKTEVHVRDNITTVGIPSVLWRLFSTVGDNSSICEG